jgi:hypothetical protein
MLAMAAVAFGGTCLFIVLYALLTQQYQRQRALVAGEVHREVDAKTKAGLELDLVLARRLGDGRPTSEAVADWQAARAELLATGRTARPTFRN